MTARREWLLTARLEAHPLSFTGGPTKKNKTSFSPTYMWVPAGKTNNSKKSQIYLSPLHLLPPAGEKGAELANRVAGAPRSGRGPPTPPRRAAPSLPELLSRRPSLPSVAGLSPKVHPPQQPAPARRAAPPRAVS